MAWYNYAGVAVVTTNSFARDLKTTILLSPLRRFAEDRNMLNVVKIIAISDTRSSKNLIYSFSYHTNSH